MKQDSLKKNFIFQFLYQVIILIIPLVISAWLTRTLGGEALGIYTFSNSIAYYFLLLCNLGILKYGQRIIVARREDNNKLRKTFWSLFSLHSFVSIFVTVLYLLYCIFLVNDNKDIYLIQTLYVISALFDITWLFYGLENFKSVVIKNIFIKVIECTLIFILVKQTSDLWIYTLIVSGGLLMGQLVMIPQAIKYVKPIGFNMADIKEHIKPLLLLFISVVATALYTIFDKTLIGLLSPSINDVAYYEYSSKIIQVPRVILFVVITVMMPRACSLAEKKDIEGHKRIIRISMTLIALIGAASTFGLLVVADKLSLLYYGEEFSVCGNIIMTMTPLILIIYVAEVIRSEYLLPLKKDYIYIIGIIISAIINILISVVLIPYIGVYGAVIGTIAAEFIGAVFVLIASKKMYNFINLFRDIFPFILDGVIMGVFIYLIDRNTPSTIFWLLMEVVIGASIYCVLSFITICLFYKELMLKIINMVKKVFSPSLKRKLRKIFSVFRRNNIKKEFTIFSNNCWGGRIYDMFGLMYTSPTIGLRIDQVDYVRFLSKLDYYLSITPVLQSTQKNLDTNKNEYIALIDDIKVVFIHYKSGQDAIDKWERRKKRIVKDNIIVKLSYSNRDSENDRFIIETFSNLPYKKIFLTTNEEYRNNYNLGYVYVLPKEDEFHRIKDEFYYSDKLVRLKDIKNIINE